MFHKGQSLYLLYGFIPSLPLPGLNQDMAATIDSLDYGVIKKMNNTNTVNAVVYKIVQTSDVGYRTVSINNTQHIWLGKLYFNLTKESICLCSENCIKVSTIEWDRVSGIIRLETCDLQLNVFNGYRGHTFKRVYIDGWSMQHCWWKYTQTS